MLFCCRSVVVQLVFCCLVLLTCVFRGVVLAVLVCGVVVAVKIKPRPLLVVWERSWLLSSILCIVIAVVVWLMLLIVCCFSLLVVLRCSFRLIVCM